MTMTDIWLMVSAYVLGSIPFAYIVVRLKKRVDIRTVGSGNVGATNVSRILGRGWGIFVFVLDVLKGFLPALVSQLLHGRHIGEAGVPLVVVLTGLAAICGHNWSIFLGFRGGKGVATSSGVFLAIFPLGLVLSLAVWAIVVKITRYISAGSMLGAIALLLFAIFLQRDPYTSGRWLTAFAALSAILSIIRHHTNIRRLLAGTEGKIGEKKV